MDDSLTERIRAAAEVLTHYGAREVYVFGSAAAGSMHPHSDVDLAVEGLPPQSFYRAMGYAYEALGMPLDLVDLSEDTPLTRNLLELKSRGALKRVA